MYKVDFSLNEFNFRVIFNDEKDYTIYKDVIENSIIDMKHKKNNNTTIKINYINDKNIYDEVFNDLKEKDKKIISSFMDEYYEKYNNVFVSSKNRYIISNNGNLNFNIICKEYYKRPELIYIIREIYVRLEENKKALFMHGNGINIDDKKTDFFPRLYYVGKE